MDTTAKMKATETLEAARIRLAAKARIDGVRIVRDPIDGRHYATSISQPGRFHYVTLLSCDCPGFIHAGRCRHHSALLAALGQLPPKPTAPACVCCGDHDAPHVATRSRWVGGARDGFQYTQVIRRCAVCQRREVGGIDRIAA